MILQRFFCAGILVGFLHFTCLHSAWQQPPNEFPVIGPSSLVPLASDANGHAIALPSDFTNVFASFYSSDAWSDLQVIGAGTLSNGDLAMDNGGTALGVWYDLISGEIRTAHFNGISWNTPIPNPLDTATVFNAVSVAVAMNGPNSGLAVWTDNGANTVRSAFFAFGVWSLPTTIGTGNFDASIAYSTNGTAVASWRDLGGGFTVNNYTGGVWQGPIVLDPTGSRGQVGIDSTGKALAVWQDTADSVVFSTFNGVSWSLPQFITTTTGNDDVRLGMTPMGTAVAAWTDSLARGFSSSYNGSVWSAPIQFTAGPIDSSGGIDLSVADNGNALVVFTNATALELRSARLPLGGTWLQEEFIASYDNPFFGSDVRDIQASLSENGKGFASWVIASEGSLHFASATLDTLPPTNLQGSVCKNNFASQTDRIKVITWTPSADPNIVSYLLRRDGVLIATIPASGPYIYLDHNRCKAQDSYTLTSIDNQQVESAPISITF